MCRRDVVIQWWRRGTFESLYSRDLLRASLFVSSPGQTFWSITAVSSIQHGVFSCFHPMDRWTFLCGRSTLQTDVHPRHLLQVGYLKYFRRKCATTRSILLFSTYSDQNISVFFGRLSPVKPPRCQKNILCPLFAHFIRWHTLWVQWYFSTIGPPIIFLTNRSKLSKQ